MRRGYIERTKRVEPVEGLFGIALVAGLAFVFGIERMDAFRRRRDLREAEQNLVEQVRAAFREGNAEESRPAIFRRGQRREARALGQFFRLVERGAEQGFHRHGKD